MRPSAIRCFSSAAASLKKTPLYDLHVSLGGKMVPFAGYSMPVQYQAGVLQSHLHTREQEKASLFDVSHMGQLRITGKDRLQFLESVVVGDLQALGSGEAKLSLITNDQGGIIDDCVVSRYDDHLYVVVNAGNQDVDLVHMHKLSEGFKGDASIERIQDRALVALQGPGAVDVVETLNPNVNLKDLEFMHGVFTPLKLKDGKQVDVILTRCGYTGEDGFEISVLSKDAETFARALLDDERVAGLCLHGHDITDKITPIEATLAWTIGKRRREEGGFPGHSIIMDQLKNKTATKKRVGFVVDGAAAREGAELFDADDNVVGHVTSGTFSPSLKKAIGMAYVNKNVGKIGTDLHVKARKKTQQGCHHQDAVCAVQLLQEGVSSSTGSVVALALMPPSFFLWPYTYTPKS
ncbi:aminomethyltransferase [Phytophthora infestans T30-4]|uniref:Aminomethyltransferase n=1 Tax=Phytophthora infestans (strain T30-4) TaxID=403677 RepID=D0NQF6_PHYIT|nr:aminomethyltransferase [Phytophthora infestans T30-4]EEY62888.1 aminomethyltransferase [Phytophthora infestans T30-4]|eukprot:XP_002898763.1 aminomethyltransferase [Phytophthora infestans T30-4]